MARKHFGAIRKLPSGRFQASYVVAKVRYNAATTFPNASAAQKWLARIQTSIADGTWVAPEVAKAAQKAAEKARKAREVPFSVFAGQWLSKRHTKAGKPLRATTVNEYQRLLRGPLAEFADMPVGSITEVVVMDWHADQLSTGKTTQAARSYALLSSVMRDAVKRGLIEESPCTIEGAASTTTGREVVPPSVDELAVILSVLREPYASLALVAAWSGLRFGELTELRTKDVAVNDAGKITLNVRRGVTHVTGNGANAGPPKTPKGVRKVVMPTFTNGAILGRLRGADDLLWHAPTSPDRHLRQSTLAKHWDPARKAAGRGADDEHPLPWHGLRHYAASAYAQTGASEAEIMDRLGQKSPGISRRYTHSLGREYELVDRLG